MLATRPLVLAAALVVPLIASGGSAVETESYDVLELEAPAPPWWTSEARAMADRAGAQGMLVNPLTGELVDPRQAPGGGVPAGAPDYLFIRPGALFLLASLCTYNFIYGSGTKIGTAGHCVDFTGQTVYILAAPTVPLVTALGSVSSFQNGGIGNDWALINISPSWNLFVDPNMAYLGGPSCSAWTGGGGLVKHTGHGIQTGLVASVPRTSLANPSNGNSFSGIGEISGGDSGSPIVQAASNVVGCVGGSAAGVLTHCATITGIECLPIFWGTDIRKVAATVTPGFDPL